MAQLISISLTWQCREGWAGRSMYAMAEVTSDCSGEKGRALFRKLCPFPTLLPGPFSGNKGPHSTAVVEACYLAV